MVAGADALDRPSDSPPQLLRLFRVFTDAAQDLCAVYAFRFAVSIQRETLRRPRLTSRSRRGGRERERRRARRARSGSRARLLGARLAPFPARQGRDRERDLHRPHDPDRLRRRAARAAATPVTGRTTSSRRLLPGTARTSRSRSSASCRRRSGPSSRTRTRSEDNVMVLGAANRLGQDEFLRLLYGARVSLEVAIFSTLGVMIIGVILGSIAGYFRGWTDTIISRVTEISMAFPVLLFVIALAATVGPRLNQHHVRGLSRRGGDARSDLQPLRLVLPGAHHARPGAVDSREGVHRGGADDRRERRPDHPFARPAAPVAPMIVYSTLIVASYVLAEAGLSFLGVGIPIERPELGQPPRRARPSTTRRGRCSWCGRAWRPAGHAGVQPARRRPQGRVRPALEPLRTKRFSRSY